MDLSSCLHDDFHNPIDIKQAKQKLEKELIKITVAPAMTNSLMTNKQTTKVHAATGMHTISNNLKSTIGNLNDVMRGKYIKSAITNVHQVISKINNFVD